METFEVDGKVIENKPIFMVEIFWNGDTDDRGMGNWEILDEKMLTGRYVYMSMYRSEESAERGFNRWLNELDKRYREAVEIHSKLIELGLDKKYPKVMREFVESSGYSKEWDELCQMGDYSTFHPKAHKINRTDTKKMNSAFSHFYEPHYEED